VTNVRNVALEGEIATQERNLVGPLSLWRRLPASAFVEEADEISSAVTSLVTATKLAPDWLISEILLQESTATSTVWNELCVRFDVIDGLNAGIAGDVAGSCAALSATQSDPLGLIHLLNRLSQPLVRIHLGDRLSVAASWLGRCGVLLNASTLSQVDWDRHRFLTHSTALDGAPF
jgi:hypothetical protein